MRDSWLDGAEVSVSVQAGTVQGVSFFLDSVEEVDAFLDAVGRRQQLEPHESRMRERFDVVPRRWIKLPGPAGGPVTCSQYFQIDPRLAYPITTVRTFGRMYGARVSGLEQALAPALEDRTAAWYLVVKHRSGAIVPRIACRVRRPVAVEMLRGLARHGYATVHAAQRYTGLLDELAGGFWCYLSFEPTSGEVVCVDLEDVPADSETRKNLRLGAHERFRYMKFRLDPGSGGCVVRTAYVPLPQLANAGSR